MCNCFIVFVFIESFAICPVDCLVQKSWFSDSKTQRVSVSSSEMSGGVWYVSVYNGNRYVRVTTTGVSVKIQVLAGRGRQLRGEELPDSNCQAQNNCNGNGRCVFNKCVCEGLWSGSDCATAVPKLEEQNTVQTTSSKWHYFYFIVTDSLETKVTLSIDDNSVADIASSRLVVQKAASLDTLQDIKSNALTDHNAWAASKAGKYKPHSIRIANKELSTGQYIVGAYVELKSTVESAVTFSVGVTNTLVASDVIQLKCAEDSTMVHLKCPGQGVISDVLFSDFHSEFTFQKTSAPFSRVSCDADGGLANIANQPQLPKCNVPCPAAAAACLGKRECEVRPTICPPIAPWKVKSIDNFCQGSPTMKRVGLVVNDILTLVAQCTLAAQSCTPDTCHGDHGSCSTANGLAQCACTDKWTGSDCNTPAADFFGQPRVVDGVLTYPARATGSELLPEPPIPKRDSGAIDATISGTVVVGGMFVPKEGDSCTVDQCFETDPFVSGFAKYLRVPTSAVTLGTLEQVSVGEKADSRRLLLDQKYYVDGTSITGVKIPYKVTTATPTETAMKVVAIKALSQNADRLARSLSDGGLVLNSVTVAALDPEKSVVLTTPRGETTLWEHLLFVFVFIFMGA